MKLLPRQHRQQETERELLWPRRTLRPRRCCSNRFSRSAFGSRYFQLIFTLRSTGEGGKFANTSASTAREKARIYRAAARQGTAVFDVEVVTDAGLLPSDFLPTPAGSPAGQKVVLSAHSDDYPLIKTALLKKRAEFGCARILAYKIVSVAKNRPLLEEFVAKELGEDGVPVILIYRDDAASRVWNKFLTPVCLTKPVFPGQLSLTELEAGRQLFFGTTRPGGSSLVNHFYLVGNPIYKSKSPLWHNYWFDRITAEEILIQTTADAEKQKSGFTAAESSAVVPLSSSQLSAGGGLQGHASTKMSAANNYHYALFPTSSAETVKRELLDNKATTGLSVTMPLKEKLFPYLDSVSPEAQKIGAVNTVYRLLSGGTSQSKNGPTSSKENSNYATTSSMPAATSELTVTAPLSCTSPLTRAQNNRWAGDNTDWLALRDVLAEKVVRRSASSSGPGASFSVAVIGTGGTARAACYALQHLHLPFSVVAPRDLAKAEKLAEEFRLPTTSAAGGSPPDVGVSRASTEAGKGKAVAAPTSCYLLQDLMTGGVASSEKAVFDVAISCVPPEIEIVGPAPSSGASSGCWYNELIDFAYGSERREKTTVDGLELLARQAEHQLSHASLVMIQVLHVRFSCSLV
ncbi:unnamed protein product [Amoebophrya sp. A120]|nr:unnamed protein product [Amoebophrya sp. A120]|eukprot:GSA120T00010254001.1